MALINLSQVTVNTSGTVTVRLRPSLLLMKARLRAAKTTLQLGLATLKIQCEAASQWLRRLGAIRVEFGEPHFDDQADKDPLTKMTAALGQRTAGASPAGRGQGVNLVVTAAWDIASLPAEETLVLLERLRSETAEEGGAAEAAEGSRGRAALEGPLREIIAQFHLPTAAERAPQFLFIARLGEEQLEKASAEAFSRARRNAERLARAAGMRLGKLSMHVHFGYGGAGDGRPDRLMDRQRCGALLAGSTYDLAENEVVSDDPRSTEFPVSVHVSHTLE